MWEFDEWYDGKQYWAELNPEYVSRLNDAYRVKDLEEVEKHNEDWWYEWHFDIMTQYRYFYNKWGKRRCKSRSIRRIVIPPVPFR